MHSAPSVNYPVGHSRSARRLLLSIWLLGASGMALACLQSGGAAWRQALLGLSVLGAGAAAWAGFRRASASGALNFDGRNWSITGFGGLEGARASVALDLQSLMLVRLDVPAGRRRWLWLDRRAQPETWLDLRRALHSRAVLSAEPFDPAAGAHPAAGAAANPQP
jgi:toxin CptA